MLGYKASLPIFIAPAAMGRLAHTEGEKCLTRAAASHGIPYIVSPSLRNSQLPAAESSHLHLPEVSANSSVSFEELASLTTPDQTLMYQVRANLFRIETQLTTGELSSTSTRTGRRRKTSFDGLSKPATRQSA
jgi:L-lactate dehydrogenase (cytochrome)